jgi:lipopolysaccharide/colanic/teichoic acid biosynthesis glycosyltransferase
MRLGAVKRRADPLCTVLVAFVLVVVLEDGWPFFSQQRWGLGGRSWSDF